MKAQAELPRFDGLTAVSRVELIEAMKHPHSTDDPNELHAMVAAEELVQEGRRIARMIWRHGERGISRQGFINLARCFRDGTIGASVGFLLGNNAFRTHRSLQAGGTD